MNIKNLLLLALAAIVTFALGFGAIWAMLGHSPDEAEKPGKSHARKNKEAATLTSTVDLFQVTLPCKRTAEGTIPIVHADFQLVVPIKHRLKVEENASRIRDIIATLLRESDINDINRDNLVSFKQHIVQQSHDLLGVEIEEILVLRFDYDVIRPRKG